MFLPLEVETVISYLNTVTYLSLKITLEAVHFFVVLFSFIFCVRIEDVATTTYLPTYLPTYLLPTYLPTYLLGGPVIEYLL